MTTPVWPWRLLTPKTETWTRKATVISGGASLSGIEQTMATTGGGWWQATLSGFQLFTPDQVLAWRAFEALLDGGVGQIVVPKPDLVFAPRPYAGGELMRPGAPAPPAAGDWFNWDPGLGSTLISAKNVGAATLRATQLVIEMDVGQPPRAGQFFSIDHATAGWRLYVIQQVVSVNGQRSTVNIRPPLREAVADQAAVEFDTPRCLMSLDPTWIEKVSVQIELGRQGQASVQFREAF